MFRKLSCIILFSSISLFFPNSVQANKFSKVLVTVVAVPVCLAGGAVIGGVKGAAKGARKGFTLMRKPKPKPVKSQGFDLFTKILKNAPYQFLPAL